MVLSAGELALAARACSWIALPRSDDRPSIVAPRGASSYAGDGITMQCSAMASTSGSKTKTYRCEHRTDSGFQLYKHRSACDACETYAMQCGRTKQEIRGDGETGRRGRSKA